MEDFTAVRWGLNVSHNASPAPPSMSIDRLFPALLECFGIILCGYVAGRANIITSTQARGLGNFVSKFALPALLFKNMVLLDFGNVIWAFLWSILIAKVTVFVIVCSLTLLVTSRETRFGKAGLFSIFATQSNDFALGYPIVEALYKNTYPEYLQYIYLVAPVSLMILNPIGFAFCEIQKWRESEDQRQSKKQIVGQVLLQVLKNPIVFMVILGIVFHFLLGQRVPTFMEEFVDGLANSFGGAALFYLGLSMVGQLRKLTRSSVIALILLITAKLLVMPLICRDMVELLDTGNTSSLNHSSLSNFAFLYGVFPTAPSVAIYAAQYNMELEVVTSGMVISTFLSAPIMYVSAWLLTIPWMDPKELASALQNVGFNVSIVSLVAVVWTVSVMVLSKKYRRLPHVFTMNLFLAQFLVCISMILWNFIVEQDNFIGQVLTFALLYGSIYSTYVWTGLIAFSLALMKRDDELKVQPGIFMTLGWGVPVLVVGVLLIAGEKTPDNIDSAFFYGRSQVISTAVVLASSILLGGCSLTGLSRGIQESNYQALDQGLVSGTREDLRPQNSSENQVTSECAAVGSNDPPECHTCDCVQPEHTPDMIVSPSISDLASINADQCEESCQSPRCFLAPEEEPVSDRQVARHVLLCLLLTICQLAGFISFGIFGMDKHLIILPFKKRLVSLWQGRERVEESQAAVPEEIRLTCTQFVRYHRDQCVQDIMKKRRCGEGTVVETFLGSELVDWLLRVGLAQDQGEALLYGQKLMEGRVLHGVAHESGFWDDGLHYRFSDRGEPER
ncbi:lysosomal cholesterol signaling protein isoform X2 [Conger conger]|uniref:lysosomal cholesterol signaling protein isoform X2 n=1 Tax=Conger conger TaxID=82655 RepID=UPI002A5A9C4B|nr:lysosomal cholesterol signaling protein isoform X2 [Conger conger]